VRAIQHTLSQQFAAMFVVAYVAEFSGARVSSNNTCGAVVKKRAIFRQAQEQGIHS